MRFSNNGKHQYLKLFGWVCIAFGLISGFDALQVFNDPNATVILNGIERTDAEAKLTVLFIPVIFIVFGIVLNLISLDDVQKINSARDKFWSVFRNE